jgi:fumarate hydratase class II
MGPVFVHAFSRKIKLLTNQLHNFSDHKIDNLVVKDYFASG